MQKLIAKYGLAAHLAILATAPLFLFPFCSEWTLAKVLLWLSLLAACWTMMEPSVLADERPHTARKRVKKAVLHDPLFWILLVLSVLAGLRAMNGGIALAYDAEQARWYVAEAPLSLLPGCVKGVGGLPFAGVIAFSVLVMAGRHALGKSARGAFLSLSAFLAGLTGVALIMGIACGGESMRVVLLALGASPAPIGAVFGLYLLAGLAALVTAFEHRWYRLLPCFFLGICGSAAAVFVFSPPAVVAAVAALALTLMAYGFVYACFRLKGSGKYRLLVFAIVSLTAGALMVAALVPTAAVSERLASVLSFELLPGDFWSSRKTLDTVSFRMWFSNLWLGTGLGSFPIAFRFSVEQADWLTLPRTVTSASCGWIMLLAERGLAGTLAYVIPFLVLAFGYLLRLIRWLPLRVLPEAVCWVGLLVVPFVFVLGFLDSAILRTDVMTATGAIMAVSATSFPLKRDTENG